MKTADIYLITNLINGKQYVGQTIRGYLHRWKGHCMYANRKVDRTSPQLIDKVIDKYGIENFKVELLETVPIIQKDIKEQYYIEKYDTYNNGYNLTIGGDYNPMTDINVKNKHLQKMQSLEHRLKVSKSVRDRLTPELRKLYGEGTKNRWNNWSLEERNNCIKGFNNYNNSRKQKVAIVDENDNIIEVFESCADACKYCNKPTKEAGHILLVCDKFNKNGKRAKYFGYYWKKL